MLEIIIQNQESEAQAITLEQVDLKVRELQQHLKFKVACGERLDSDEAKELIAQYNEAVETKKQLKAA